MTNSDEKDETSQPLDTDESLVNSTVNIGDFAILEVVAIEEVGAFLDWGLPKDLFLPFAEQLRGLRIGQHIIVYVYLDNTNRPAASMRLERHFENATSQDLKPGEAVALTVYSKTELGYKCIVNGRYQGLLFANEVFQPIDYADELTGYVKKVREDGKLDLSLASPDVAQRTGHKAALEIGPRILESLKEAGGFMPINDRTPPEKIYELFGVSKKKYKIALGDLYKRKLLTVEDEGIRLAKPSTGTAEKPAKK